MFLLYRVCGVDLQSQEAYDLAAGGLLRPRVNKATYPTIYNIKCIHFQPPDFTLGM